MDPTTLRFGGASRPWKRTRTQLRACGTDPAKEQAGQAVFDPLRYAPGAPEVRRAKQAGSLSLGSYKGSPPSTWGRQGR